jgi:hypothetical protein
MYYVERKAEIKAMKILSMSSPKNVNTGYITVFSKIKLF